MRITCIVTYSCRHTRIFEDIDSPKIGDEILCLKCDKYVMVVNAPAEYRIRCRKCKFSKSFGTDKIGAELKMVNHRKGKPDHTVDLYNGRVIIRTFADYGQTRIVA